MNKFLINLSKSIILVFIFLFAVQKCLDYYLKNSKDCKYIIWNNIFNGEIDAEVVIIGNSRADSHYNSEVISKNTRLKTFNLGESGSPINLLTAKWNAYLSNNKKPKLLIVDVDYNFLGNAENLYTKWQYLPFFNKPEIKALRKTLKANYYLDTYVPLYKYKGYQLKYFKELLANDVSGCENFKDGFVINKSSWKVTDWKNFNIRIGKENVVYDFKSTYTKGIANLKEVVLNCKKNNIEVCFIWSPQYKEVQSYNSYSRKKIDSVLNVVSKENNIKYFNFDKDSLVFSKDNFYNHSHLNYNGANKFSKQIADSINLYFKK
jgi:hypothetical protein